MKERSDELGYEPTEHAIPTGSGRELRGPSSSVRELEPASRAGSTLSWLHPGSTLAAGRFEIVSMLGMGGMGVVYSAWDTQRADQVALKTLHRADAVGIYRFKNEFRSLADVHHPNLVRLYELFFESEHWFFTMELVQGTRFDQWVRPNDQLDPALLRAALLQLVDAIDAIHAAGKLHRDIKPNNVLVTDTGRVVVLDFGLVVEHGGGRGQTLVEPTVMGTPDYMAPEQAAGLPADVACDYYAIGVMLFEALTGKLPFEGHAGDVLAAKQQDAAPVARSCSQGNDCDELLELCDALLARTPQERPRAAAIRARIAGARAGNLSPAAVSGAPGASSRPAPGELTRPVGREHELEQLREAYRASEAGQAVLMYVDGESGIGKTALCQAFLDELRGADRALVLAGRCYEQENIPFKVLDPMLDDLSRQLRRLPSWLAAALLPRDAHALTQLFSSLTRVEAFAQAPARPIADAQERERRALAALHELLARIRDRQPLVIYLDDLQWMDADSAKVLRHLLVRRTPVALLWILCARTQDASRNPWLTSVLEAARKNRTLAQHALQLGPLSDADARRLAQRVLSDDAATASAEAIARQAAGSPFFVTELARFVLERGASPELSLHAVVSARIDELPAPARRVLAVLAVAGRPLPMPVALAAADADYAALDQLRTAHLLRGGADSSQRLIDCYHDRIREQVRHDLDDATLRVICERLSRALSGRDDADPELLSRCLDASGDRAGAARCLGVAADRAFAALAFDRAAALYERVLDMASASDPQRRALSERHGDALAHAGRGPEAAAAYEHAASLCSGDDALELRRRAAEQLLATGHVEAGTTLLGEVCAQLGLHVPQRTGTALVSLLGTQARLYLSDLDREPSPAAVSGQDALRLRTARTLVTGVLGYLPVFGASNADRYLLMALSANDRNELVRALGFTAYWQTLVHPGNRRAGRLLARMEALAERDASRELRGFASLMRGMAAFHHDGYKLATTHLARALQQLHGCPGTEWEIDAGHVYEQMCAAHLGHYERLVHTTPPLIEEAFRRGRVWAGAMLSGFAGMPAWLCLDDPQGYRAQLREARGRWQKCTPLRWPDYFMLVGEATLETYSGDPARGFALLNERHADYQRSRLTTGTSVGAAGYAGHLARCAASALRSVSTPSTLQRGLWRQAIDDARQRLTRLGSVRGQAAAHALEAALALDDGATEQASVALRRAIADFDAAELGMCAAAARRRLGQLLAGDQGRELIVAGEAFMTGQGVKNIEALTELGCPGCRV